MYNLDTDGADEDVQQRKENIYILVNFILFYCEIFSSRLEKKSSTRAVLCESDIKCAKKAVTQ